MKTTKLLSGILFVGVLATATGIASAEETPTPTTPVTEVTATPTPTPTPTPSIVISNSRAQLDLTREQWENGYYSNPYSDAEMVHEPTAIDLTHPSYDASPEVWSNWYMARVENCKTLTKDREYIDCMYRPWVYGF